jgi:hypothetical protein
MAVDEADEALENIPGRWEEACERGQAVSVEELSHDHLDLIAQVRQRITAIRDIERRMEGELEGAGYETLTQRWPPYASRSIRSCSVAQPVRRRAVITGAN